MYRNQFQLTTPDALYSDGDRYMPALAVTKDLGSFLPSIKNVLVLGTGLGSMVRVMKKKGYEPRYTLVEKDKVVLQWALELADTEVAGKIDPVCDDAGDFMQRNTKKYDLVFIDVFNGRVVPEFVSTPDFLKQCRDSLAQGGYLAFNYIVNDVQEWEQLQNIFAGIFPGYHVFSKSINRILISAPKP